MSACTFPNCWRTGTETNRAGQPTCGYHRPVVIATTDDLGNKGRHCEDAEDA